MAQRVVQRELSRAHDERNHARRVHVHIGLLAVGQEIGRGAVAGVPELARELTER